MRFDDFLFSAILALFVVVPAIVFIVYVPYGLHVEQKCLSSGYPKSTVTWNLEGYCLNLEGTVTVKVDKLNAKR